MSDMVDYYEQAFSKNVSGDIYMPFSTLEKFSHLRRMELLASLDLPQLNDLTVVDYGVGAWGFGCIFPKLKQCKIAIGMDISSKAIELSSAISEKDPELAGKDVFFFTSSGYVFPLLDNSVDIFFSGECIEHIEDTDTFLSEVHRVLRVGGMAIFTTPNSQPYLYRTMGIRWCVGYEHVALMSASELLTYVTRYFDVFEKKGFNQSLYPSLDDSLPDEFSEAWVSSNEHDFENATGLIISCLKKESKRREPRTSLSVLDYKEAIPDGEFSDLELVSGQFGRMVRPGHRLTLPVPIGAKRVNLIFWGHQWSGGVKLSGNSNDHYTDLYSHVGGCIRIVKDLNGEREFVIEASDLINKNSLGREVIFVRAVFVSNLI